MTTPATSPLQTSIDTWILHIRGQKVIIDADLATLYGVPTRALNQAVKRNGRRFPPDFMFQLDVSEKQQVVTDCDHLTRLKFSKTLPFAFTEHGAIQAANVLNSEQAIDMGMYVVRAFVRLRTSMLANRELAQRLQELEHRTELLSLKHSTFELDTRAQLKQVFLAIKALMTPSQPSAKRPIGFITPADVVPPERTTRTKPSV